MSLKNLSLKTATLLALCTAQRAQTLSMIELCNIRDNNEQIEIIICEPIKTSRPGFKQPLIRLPRFTDRPDLCIYSCLKHYIEATSIIRDKTEKYLFIGISKPHKNIGSQTISRWIKSMLKLSGIDVSIFSGHSTRSASTSKAYSIGIDLEIIINSAGWSERSRVFAKYYNKPIIDNNNMKNFATRLLGNYNNNRKNNGN